MNPKDGHYNTLIYYSFSNIVQEIKLERCSSVRFLLFLNCIVYALPFTNCLISIAVYYTKSVKSWQYKNNACNLTMTPLFLLEMKVEKLKPLSLDISTSDSVQYSRS